MNQGLDHIPNGSFFTAGSNASVQVEGKSRLVSDEFGTLWYQHLLDGRVTNIGWCHHLGMTIGEAFSSGNCWSTALFYNAVRLPIAQVNFEVKSIEQKAPDSDSELVKWLPDHRLDVKWIAAGKNGYKVEFIDGSQREVGAAAFAEAWLWGNMSGEYVPF